MMMRLVPRHHRLMLRLSSVLLRVSFRIVRAETNTALMVHGGDGVTMDTTTIV